MANSLGRTIEVGERVVHRNGRVFICNGTGFGTKAFTSGTAVYGNWDGGLEDRISGYDIDVDKTNALKG